LDIDDFAGSTPRLVVAAGCSVWSPNYRNLTAPSLAEAKGLGLKVIPGPSTSAPIWSACSGWGSPA
jgi:hypothetical protein